MSKKTTGTDVGYRAYFAAFAIMIIIVVAAVCILSGCLDEIIFKSDTPAADNQIENQGKDNSDIPDAPDTQLLPDENDSSFVDTETVSTPEETEKDTEKEDETTTKEEDTTKAPETTTKEEDTTPPPEVTTPEVTTPEITTPDVVVTTPEETPAPEEYDKDEIFTEQDNNILYSYDDEGLIITGYDGPIIKLTIANELDGVEVIAIGNRAFENIGSIIEVKISAGVKKIGSKAFANCSLLNYVFIPSSVKDIASNAFEGSTNIIIYGVKGSYAEHFASDNGLEFREV